VGWPAIAAIGLLLGAVGPVAWEQWSVERGGRVAAHGPAAPGAPAAAPPLQHPPFPNSPAAAGSAEGDAALRPGVAALNQGRLPAAVRAFERAVRLAPRSALAHDYLGIAYLRERRFAAALRQFRAETRLAPGSAYGWARIADVYEAQGKVSETIPALERAVALQPELGQLYLNLSLLYLQATELGKAVTALETYGRLQPEDAYGHYLRGAVFERLARLDEAERALGEALRLSPRSGLYQLALARVLLRLPASPGNTDRASAALQRALQFGVPEPAEAHYQLGLCSQRQGAWEVARRELATAVALAPDAWAAWYALQDVLNRLGRHEEARQALRRFRVLRAREDARRERRFFTQEVSRHPDHADTHYQLAEFLARAGERPAARRAVGRAWQLFDPHRDPPALERRIRALSGRLSPGSQRSPG
jgi:tetratricopeptide (TPR) repeat protein